MTPDLANLPLRPPHLPAPVSWWPPAPGWWLLGIGSLLLLLGGWWLLRRWRRQGRIPRSARRELHRLRRQYRQGRDGPLLARELSVLLRRIALTLHPRERVARLTGTAWLDFLDQALAGGKEAGGFTRGPGRALIEAPYNPNAAVDGEALLRLAHHWIAAATRRRP